MIKKSAIIGFLFICLLVSFNCKTKLHIKGVDLDITFSEELSDNLLTDMTFTWTTDSEFEKLNQDMNIFVHIWHGNNLLIQDDHNPQIPTTQWEPNNQYSYERTIYIPSFIDSSDPNFKGEDNLRLSVGFYSPYDRTGDSKNEIIEKNLVVQSQPEDTPKIEYGAGWHDLEIDPNTYHKQWRWTTKVAYCTAGNPHRDATLIIKGGVQFDVFQDQVITFKINDQILDEFVPEETNFEKTYVIEKDEFGEEDIYELTFETDKSFIPAKQFEDSQDFRELGMVISFLYFR